MNYCPECETNPADDRYRDGWCAPCITALGDEVCPGRGMTPNEMLAHVQATVPSAYIGNTGGNCGAIIVDTPRGELLVTTDSGPWATPDDDNVSRETSGWFVSLQDGEGTWIDSELERDGDHLVMDDYVPRAVDLLARFADWSHRGIIHEGTV